MKNRFLRVASLTLGVLLLASSSVQADNYETTFILNNDTTVTVQRTDPTNPTGPLIMGEGTWAVPFTVTDTSTNASFTGFCIDLYHNVSDGETTTNNPGFVNVAGAVGAGTGGASATPFPNFSGYSDLGSKLNYLGGLFNLFQATHANDNYLLGAVQLAVWTLLDANFAATGEATGMANDLAAITKLMGGSGANGTAVSTFYTDVNGTNANAYGDTHPRRLFDD